MKAQRINFSIFFFSFKTRAQFKTFSFEPRFPQFQPTHTAPYTLARKIQMFPLLSFKGQTPEISYKKFKNLCSFCFSQHKNLPLHLQSKTQRQLFLAERPPREK
jgi:hypothetical protein